MKIRFQNTIPNVMARTFKIKNSVLPTIFLLSLLFSCHKDTELLSNHMLGEEKIVVNNDNFRIPVNRISVLDVLSNDNYISSRNTRIVETTPPSKGKIRINEDNTITYIPKTANNEIMGTGSDPTLETISEEVATTDETSSQMGMDENTSEESPPEEITAVKETFEETITSQETPGPQTQSIETTSTEVVTQEDESEEETTSVDHVDTYETGASNVEDLTSTTENTSSEYSQEENSLIANTVDNTSEDSSVEEIQEDSFTYTTKTENEDGSMTTETATVTVILESETKSQGEVTSETQVSSETDFWRDPVIAGSRLLDEKYYDLDSGEIYSKEVNLQRGQVENYIEHENCPQRIKVKWANRIEISPSDVNGSQNGLQKVFDAHPRGSLFYLQAGVYQDQKNAVLRNDQDVVGAYGAILDGSGIQGNSEASTRAIRSMERGYICNLKVREYPTWNDPQNPKNPRGAALEVIENGAILNCEVHSHNTALSVIYGSKAMWNIFTAGRLGIFGYGSHDPNSSNRRGAIVKYNEWYNCNFNGYDGEYEAGGAKFVQVDGTIWSHNYIHDIPSGAGIWEDGDNRESLIYKNVIIKSHRAILSELSHTSNINHNTIEYGTGFGAIYMSNSQREKVHHNFIRWCRNGITIRDIERGSSKIYPGQAWRGINNEIYDNYIWQIPDPSTWTHGMLTLFDGHIDPNNSSNRWHGNHYHIDNNGEGTAPSLEKNLVFMYSKLAADSDHKTISWEEWKKQSGEANSTLEYDRFY